MRLQSAQVTDAEYSIGDVAALARVSVRTLRHYDKIAVAPGMAQYVHDAILANADAHETTG